MNGATGAPSRVDVLVVEDHALLAESLRLALAGEGVGTALVRPDSWEAVLTAVQRERPRLVLLDLDLGEAVGDGVDLVVPVRDQGSEVLVVTGVTDRARVAAAVEAGAVGWVPKGESFDRLLAAVQAVLAGEQVLGAAERHELLDLLRRRRSSTSARRAPFERLSPRERLVLRALAEGHSVDSIAARYVVSRATVRTQVRGILTKLDVGTQLAAVALARQSGWLDEP